MFSFKGAGLGLFANKRFKQNQTIAPFWGRYVVLPKEEHLWPENIEEQLFGCRNRLLLISGDFQPIVPKGTGSLLRPGITRAQIFQSAQDDALQVTIADGFEFIFFPHPPLTLTFVTLPWPRCL